MYHHNKSTCSANRGTSLNRPGMHSMHATVNYRRRIVNTIQHSNKQQSLQVYIKNKMYTNSSTTIANSTCTSFNGSQNYPQCVA